MSRQRLSVTSMSRSTPFSYPLFISTSSKKYVGRRAQLQTGTTTNNHIHIEDQSNKTGKAAPITLTGIPRLFDQFDRRKGYPGGSTAI
jgi:hypothetical protein